MNQFCGWLCLWGVVVGLGFVGLFVLMFSPRISIPFWLFTAFSVSLPTTLGLFLGAALDVVFRNSAPIFTAIGALAGMTAGVYFATGVYHVRRAR